MSVATPIAQALAYVDDCLPANQQREFERNIAADKSLAACVEQWRLQNEAIRRTFGDKAHGGVPDRAPAALPLGAAPPVNRDSPRRRESLGQDLRAQVVAPGKSRSVEPLRAAGRLVRAAVAPTAIAAVICAFSAAPVPTDRSSQLTAAAFSAFRTYAAAAQTEFATADSAALEQWLKPQLGGWVAVPSLGVGGFALIGGRVVPGAQGPAGFALYKNSAGARIALILESSENPPRLAPRTSGALTALPLTAPTPEVATLVAARGAVDLARLPGLARFSATTVAVTTR